MRTWKHELLVIVVWIVYWACVGYSMMWMLIEAKGGTP